jgi:ABC-type transporter Mla subunit MlaD
MENKSYAFAAGLFALLLGLAAILALYWLGGSHDKPMTTSSSPSRTSAA